MRRVVYRINDYGTARPALVLARNHDGTAGLVVFLQQADRPEPPCELLLPFGPGRIAYVESACAGGQVGRFRQP